ncbi:MAG TPA: hypothetical protein VN512_13005 [Clostridia bacterium]|nr:hypothetical protein [Clostridia bacterium]
MVRKILSLMTLYNTSKPEMAAALRMSLDTFYRRLKDPDEFTFGELKKAAKKLKTTVSALTEGVK